jgi:hypothetical protein
MRRKRTDAKAELEQLKARVVELRDEERAIERQQMAASAEVKQASEALAAAYAEHGEAPKAAHERLRKAKEAAARPWGEMREGARRRALRAQGEVEAFARERSADLWAEYEPRARAAAEKVDRLQRELREAIREVDLVEGEATRLLVLLGQQPQGSIPRRGLEGLALDLKRALEHATPAPIPRSAAPVVEAPPEAPRAWAAA